MRNTCLIRGGRILDARTHGAEARDLLIIGGRIADIAPPGLTVNDETEIVNSNGLLLMPGLVNAHTHGHGSLAKGMGDRWTLELLLNANPWLNDGQTLEDKHLAAKLNAAEMVLKGATAAYDLFFEFPQVTREGIDAIARGYQSVGLRAVVAPMMADRTFYQAIPGLIDALPTQQADRARSFKLNEYQSSIEVCRDLLANWPYDRSQVRPALAPTVPLHCSDPFITACGDLAEEFDVGLHMHLAESKIQAVSAMQRYGKTLTAHLADLNFLGPRFTAAHFVWPDADDISRMADAGCSVAHNPGSNLRLGSGIAPVRAMRERGLCVGIGTDGSSCSDNQNMFEAMRIGAFASRVVSPDPETWISTEDVIDMATRGSAAVLGFEKDIGQLAPGYLADIVFLDLTNINYVPLNDPTHQLVLNEDSSAVHSVMIGGKMVLRDRKFTTFDYASLIREAQDAVERLRHGAHEMRQFSEAMESAVGRFCIGLARAPYHVHRLYDEQRFI